MIAWVLKPGKGLVRYDASEIEWGYRYTTLRQTTILSNNNRPKALGILYSVEEISANWSLCCGSAPRIQVVGLPARHISGSGSY